VDLVVGGVAVVGLAMHRHGAVSRDGHAVQQLLEVGPVVLVVAEGDPGRPVGLLGRGLVGVCPREGDGGRVLVLFAQVDAEGGDGAQDQGGEQAGAIAPCR
jgi:hypothetical protein